MPENKIDISIIVTCHSEGVLLHKTIESIKQAISFSKTNLRFEVIVHADSPTTETKAYLSRIANYYPSAIVYENQFGGPGLSRNFCIEKSNGKYITMIDGDDLMSENWLQASFDLLESKPYGKYVAHSEMSVEFGTFNSVVQKYGAIDYETDKLLNVWSARWNSIIFAPTEYLKKLGYPANRPGYGFEDWLTSCSFIEDGLENILVPETVIFIRRKESNSVWDSAKSEKAVLPAHPLLSFESVRSMKLPKAFLPSSTNPTPHVQQSLKTSLKHQLKRVVADSIFEKPARRLLSAGRNYIGAKSSSIGVSVDDLPVWLLKEWKSIHSIDKQVFPTQDILQSTKVYHSLTPMHYALGASYKDCIDSTKYNSYSYILFIPWLIKGGADKFAINYANTISSIAPERKVLVIATNQTDESVWQSKLDPHVDFIDFGMICKRHSLGDEQQQRLLEQIVENSGATHLHIMNSALGYDFVEQHESYIKKSDKKVIATSFSQSTDETGRVFGFSHTHIPKIYEGTAVLTTDNTAVADMWDQEYGFDRNKIQVHHPVIDAQTNIQRIPNYDHREDDQTKYILWASRIAPEKLPHILPDIAQKLKDGFVIEMYGTVGNENYDTSFLNDLPANLRYMGSYDDFFSLPLRKYSSYLYTSLFDGIPNTLLEASSVKLPIVASAVGGVPSFIGSNRGLLVDNPLNAASYVAAIERLYGTSGLREQIGNSAYQELEENYSLPSHRKQVEDMLKVTGYI